MKHGSRQIDHPVNMHIVAAISKMRHKALQSKAQANSLTHKGKCESIQKWTEQVDLSGLNMQAPQYFHSDDNYSWIRRQLYMCNNSVCEWIRPVSSISICNDNP